MYLLRNINVYMREKTSYKLLKYLKKKNKKECKNKKNCKLKKIEITLYRVNIIIRNNFIEVHVSRSFFLSCP